MQRSPPHPHRTVRIRSVVRRETPNRREADPLDPLDLTDCALVVKGAVALELTATAFATWGSVPMGLRRGECSRCGPLPGAPSDGTMVADLCPSDPSDGAVTAHCARTTVSVAASLTSLDPAKSVVEDGGLENSRARTGRLPRSAPPGSQRLQSGRLQQRIAGRPVHSGA